MKFRPHAGVHPAPSGRRTHVDQRHDPEGVGHAAEAPALRLKAVGGDRVKVGRVLAEMVIVWGPVGVQDAAVLRQEGVGHQGADERAQADEEMQSLRPRRS